jgi:hypothetical protein
LRVITPVLHKILSQPSALPFKLLRTLEVH